MTFCDFFCVEGLSQLVQIGPRQNAALLVLRGYIPHPWHEGHGCRPQVTRQSLVSRGAEGKKTSLFANVAEIADIYCESLFHFLTDCRGKFGGCHCAERAEINMINRFVKGKSM